jgi:tetratricopeptide (TPR) repeat protein
LISIEAHFTLLAMRVGFGIAILLLSSGTPMGCATRSPLRDEQAKARYEYHRIMRTYHLPANQATNEVERAQLLDAAYTGYSAIFTKYRTARPWAAMALRAVADLHAERGDRKRALDTYDMVAALYPEEDWEVIQAWRSAGDLLWHARMPTLAMDYYARIVNRFDRPGLPPGFDAHVRIARDRLREAGASSSR